MVLSDLPAGLYKISIRYDDEDMETWVEIFPGQVSYFIFEGLKGFHTVRPPAPTLEFLPQTLPSTPTPPP
jgi:hypothetical protein